MFYSHEILTSRKYGVATVWLVATLGSHSTSKRVNKKAILDVDIPKACRVIVQPEAPMALRLQSNLLCGVTRVYSQQCGYALTDAQNIQAAMRQLIRTVRQGQQDLDLEMGRNARPEQLLLQDDPNFFPELALNMDFDLADLILDTDVSDLSASVLSPFSKRSSQTSLGSADVPALEIPSSSVGAGGFEVKGAAEDVRESRDWLDSRPVNIPEDAEELLPQPDFEFDQDGNIVDLGVRDQPEQSSVPPLQVGSQAASIVPAPVSLRPSAGPMEQRLNRDVETLNFETSPDDKAYLPIADPQATRDHRDAIPHESVHPSTESHDEEGSIYGAKAPMTRKARKSKPLALDSSLIIHKTELLSWSKDYLKNMDRVLKKKEAAKRPDSKKKAEWFVWGAGLGGLGGDALGGAVLGSPLVVLYGDQLKELLLGSAITGKKRDRDGEGDETSEGRRVRRRSEEHGRGELDIDVGELMDYEEPPEIGRRAPTPTANIPSTDLASSAMPWNLSGPFASQLGRGLNLRLQHDNRTPIVGSLQQQQRAPGSRLTSASPLHGRGIRPSRHSSLALPAGLTSRAGFTSSMQRGVGDIGGSPGDFADADEFELGGEADGSSGKRMSDKGDTQEEFERFGAAAGVDSQTAGRSQWIRRQLDAESGNFLAFVISSLSLSGETENVAGNADYAVGISEAGKSISFESLLTPASNTHVVAAQGFLHVLTLASRGLLWVEQSEENFAGVMSLGPTEKGRELVRTHEEGEGMAEDELMGDA